MPKFPKLVRLEKYTNATHWIHHDIPDTVALQIDMFIENHKVISISPAGIGIYITTAVVFILTLVVLYLRSALDEAQTV